MSSTTNETNTPESLDGLRAAYAEWRKTVETELKGVPFEKKLVTKTPEGIALQPLYTRLDTAALPAQDASAARGSLDKGYFKTPWEFAQEIALAAPADFNAALLADLNRGQNAVSISLDCATRAAKDADAAPAAEVGCCGLSVSDLSDLAAALNNVELTAVPVHINAGATALPVASLLLALAKQRGVDASKINGSVTADPLGELAARGALPDSLDSLQNDLAQWTLWASKNAPGLSTVGVDSALWLNAGGNAVQDLAYTIAATVEYIRELGKRGLTAEQVAAHLRVNFAIGPQFFMEIAKFRAFRLLWARVAAAYAIKTSPKVHARTGRWNKTKLDINVNMLRVTTEALSAVLGGVDSLHIAPYDEVMGSPDDFSRRISRNIHTLLAEEFHVTAPNDPSGGSFYIEKLTDELARKAWAAFQDIEKQGGFTAALRSGSLQTAVADTAKAKSDSLDKRRMGLVGTNLFPNLKEKDPVARPLATPEFVAARAAEVKKRRPATMSIKLAVTTKIVNAVSPDVAADSAAACIQAAAQGATIGQLFAATHPDAKPETGVTPVALVRGSEGYEALRAAADSYAKKNGARPKIFVAKMGPVLQHKARADFTAGFFSTGGFEMIAKDAYETAEDAAKAAVASGAPVAVLCSTDATYPELAPAFAKAVKAAKPEIQVILAGMPADETLAATYKAAGFDDFIHVRANVRGLLANIQKTIGA
ncbi:methylmalonyl-CoA mutase family protein [Ereboglobus luteus]|uniref:Methylmalonyl-CoA mutase n=1 Tax=Ereboglobus luteus TaxID=1796921 RepID=A0A2U8E0B2_9BACT|nr:methylmalonyl-CoA mutase family protein [Ereboglobus luteus]AWI08270.1 methylmalonyl-CoA mutase [Ereboglobus luteus]